MIGRYFFKHRKIGFNRAPAKTAVTDAFNRLTKIETPEKLKGTIIERWGQYWKNLYLDYKDVAVDIVKESRERPIRAGIITSFLGTCYYLYKHNPNERTFRDKLIQDSTKVMQVGESIRNPVSEQHVKWLEQCYNIGIVRRLSLGIVSLIWLDNYEEACALYKATCSYLKPRYVTFNERVIDIGFLDRWWLLEKKMKNYDINEVEFIDVPE